MLKGDVAVVMLAAFRGMCFLFLVRLRRGMVRATSFLKNINCFRQAIARTRGIVLLFFARVLTFRALVGADGSRVAPGLCPGDRELPESVRQSQVASLLTKTQK